MKITLERIEAVAPDQASLNAARKLLKTQKWPEMKHDDDGGLLWGACQGSGASAYRVAVACEDLGAKCSCPSRKFPCKHAIALMWWQVQAPEHFSPGEVPEWINEWLGRRRKRKGQDGASTDTSTEKGPAAAKSASAAALSSDAAPKDPERARRQRERVREAREKSVCNGLDELDLWLSDQVERGFGSFAANALEQCRLLSQRLVDAKAGGLAARIERLSMEYFSTPETQRNALLIETFGGLHLLAEAYRRQQSLAPDMRAEVRRLVGWNQSRNELLADKDALRVNGAWLVIATTRESQPDRLVRYETWLLRADRDANSDVDSDAEPAAALLVDHVPAVSAATAAPALEPGTRLEAELVFYPSTTPLRALVAQQTSAAPNADLPDPAQSFHLARADFDTRVAANPWLSACLFGCKRMSIRSTDNSWWALDAESGEGLPLVDDTAATLHGLTDIDLYGAYDGRRFLPLAANTELGVWWRA